MGVAVQADGRKGVLLIATSTAAPIAIGWAILLPAVLRAH
jgi:hypothetical protein